MYWKNWFKPWFASAIACIVIMGSCGAFIQYRLSTTEQDVLPDEVVNQARIEISGIMLVLEQHHTEVSSQNRIREELRKWSEEKQLHLQYTGLDGTILFDSSAPHSMNKNKLNLKSDLHYDLYSSKTAHEMFKLAFPVVDPDSGVQAGNAIFTLPGSPRLQANCVFSCHVHSADDSLAPHAAASIPAPAQNQSRPPSSG